MLRVTLKLCIAISLLTVIADGQNQSFEIPLDHPSKSSSAPVSKVKISTAVIATIESGDFVHPTFSPDGKTLAYSKVLVQDDFENTEVLLYDLRTHKRSVLLNSRRAKAFATYKAFVSEMAWSRRNRLEVAIGDGDVGSTRLIFDPYKRKLLREAVEGWDETELPPMPAINRKAYEQARSLFPSFPHEALDNALRTTNVLVSPDQGIVLQTNYSGHDHNLSFLDFGNKSIKALINLSADSDSVFNGGLVFKSSIILVLSSGPDAYLFLHHDGRISVLGKFKVPGFSTIEVKHVSSSKAIFLIRSHSTSERGDNPLFVFDGTQLLRIQEYAELYDAAVDTRGEQIAYCYWAGDKRHIVVKKIDLMPRAE